jgi:hypothetical protein
MEARGAGAEKGAEGGGRATAAVSLQKVVLFIASIHSASVVTCVMVGHGSRKMRALLSEERW